MMVFSLSPVTLRHSRQRGGERIYGKIRVMVFSEPQLPYTLTFTPERGGERIFGKEIIEKILYACTYRSF